MTYIQTFARGKQVRSVPRASTAVSSPMALRVILPVLVLLVLLLHPGDVHAFRSISPHTSHCFKAPRTVTTTTTRQDVPIGAPIAVRSQRETATAAAAPSSSSTALAASAGSLLSNTDTWVFVAGIFPFLWATYEFWRRIMFGESFGTGTDRVIIGMDDSPSDSRGTRVLGRGALVTAYVLFVCAFATLAVVGYSVATSEAPSDEALAAVAASVATGGIPPAAAP
eukprot:CAMPEP_0197188818 /NCGR_PEP_ID=MMETSP1423-20130617/18573_1 /TAXON_ID=476441 /ORGANISM="Pseudo-nitzschia heimii, Strain UNC1101" /LENGTH=224 /DNA_ID=CAMNT_0042640771 /DNA_START=45 /DNA_END=719 /DNA_ORIENTATION=+